MNLNYIKIPIVKIDNSLKEYLDKPIFIEKVKKANKTLRKVGLPKKKSITDYK